MIAKSSKYKMIWREAYTIPSHDISVNGRVKFYILCNLLLDSASIHAAHLHFGYDDMKAEEQYWVLSRFVVKMIKYPGFHEKIYIETWPKGVDRLFALRDFKIFSETGEEIGLATSAWIILDAITRRPKKLDHFSDLYEFNKHQHAIKELPVKISGIETADKTFSFKARFSDLDLNNHVNSGKYIEWIQNCFPAEVYHKKNISSFQINFLSETRFGEKVEVKICNDSKNNDLHFIDALKESDNLSVFRAILQWCGFQ